MRVILVTTVALCIGMGCALPNILGYLEFKKEYEPFSYLFTSDIPFDETTSYAPGASYFKQTLSLPFDIDVYEQKGKVNLRYLLPNIVEGGIGYLLKDLRLGWLVIHLVFPMLSFLLVYLLARQFTNNTIVACFSAVLFCTLGFGPRTFLNLYEGNVTQPVLFSRISPPAVTLPILLIVLINLVKNHKKQINSGVILTGVSGGLLFYTYYYYQIAYLFTLITLALAYLLFRKDLNKFVRILLIGFISSIVALPWWIQYFYTLKVSPDFIRHWPSGPYPFSFFEFISNFLLIVLLTVGYFLWEQTYRGNKNNPSKFFDSGYLPIYIFILTTIFIHCIMSRFVYAIIDPRHFSQQISHGFTILVFSCILGSRLFLHSHINKFLLTFFICVLIALLFIKQTMVWQCTKEYYRADPGERIAEEIIEKCSTAEDVIGISNPYLNSVFPSRLWRCRFYAFFGLSNVDRWENLQRYLFIQKVFNKPWDKIEKELLAEEDTIVPLLKTVSIPYLINFKYCYSKGEIQEIEKQYKFLNRDFLITKKLNYLLCLDSADERNLALGAKSLDINIKLVLKCASVSLYEVISDQDKISTND